jgi:hypothetical protein
MLFLKLLGMIHFNTDKGCYDVLAKEGILLLVIHNHKALYDYDG